MTVSLIWDVLSWALILSGTFFIIIGAIGLIRMPDVYTRMHGASLIDSIGSGLLILGLIIQAGPTIVAIKLAILYGLIFFTTPVASHAVAQAALTGGVEPELAEDRRSTRDRETAEPTPPTSGDTPAP